MNIKIAVAEIFVFENARLQLILYALRRLMQKFE